MESNAKSHLFIMGKQLIFLLLLALFSVLASCRSSIRDAPHETLQPISTKTYFFNADGREYMLIHRDDSLCHALVYSSYDTSFNRFVGMQIESGFTLKSTDETKKLKSHSAIIVDLLFNKSTSFVEIDSTTFWTELSTCLDTVTFDLSTAWKLLDQTFQRSKDEYPRMAVDRLKINGKKYTRMSTPMLSFVITVDRDGKILETVYQSWYDSQKIKDLIKDVEKELKRQRISPYTLFGVPVKTKMRISVDIVDTIT